MTGHPDLWVVVRPLCAAMKRIRLRNHYIPTSATGSEGLGPFSSTPGCKPVPLNRAISLETRILLFQGPNGHLGSTQENPNEQVCPLTKTANQPLVLSASGCHFRLRRDALAAWSAPRSCSLFARRFGFASAWPRSHDRSLHPRRADLSPDHAGQRNWNL